MKSEIHRGFAPILIVLIVAVVIALGGGALYYAKKFFPPKPVACTEEAKQCPDGSYVSRTGTNCEFAECPMATSTAQVTSTQDATAGWKTYRNEKYGFEVKYPAGFIAEELKDLVHDFDLSIYLKGNYGEGEEIPSLNIFVDHQPLKFIKNAGKIYLNINEFVSNEPEWFKSLSRTKLVDFNSIKAAKSLTGQYEGYTQYNFINSSKFFSVYIDRFIDTTEFENIAHTFKFISSVSSATGILAGHVSIGPICPVERIDMPCPVPPEAYASREFLVLSSDQSKTITSLHANASGTYSVSLPSGNYVVVSAKTGIGFLSKDLPATIMIKSGQTTTLNISVDTGIR